ncbi:hypothetical protein PR048_003659 [Dryococelus australis]|uniref:Tubulin--tyrosine ligase-like protein 12 SET-like domain-containing protein n=1 Tax=Dryococelus australis TaxID=614101 RepID=A0ABQ9IPX5_9NEOP|nr:hypothetical protein PR048_003659 [Dryococelus australis]
MLIMDGLSVYGTFLALHKSQLESSCVPERFWQTLCKKVGEEIFDAGSTFGILKIDPDDGSRPSCKVIVNETNGVNAEDPAQIYLIDHAWSYRQGEARHHLQQIPGLLDRMVDLMGIERAPSVEESITLVIKEMWKFNHTYSIGSPTDVSTMVPVWYIMDEFGSAIQHSDEPTFRIIPFLHLPEQIPYSVLFPIKNVANGGEVTVDYIEGPEKNPLVRAAMLLPWVPVSFLSEDFRQMEPDKEYFLEGHVPEMWSSCDSYSRPVFSGEKLKVFSEYSLVNEYLSDPRFEFTDDEETANILWYTTHFKDYEKLSDSKVLKFVNQFPFEHVITVKDLLAIVCRRNNVGKIDVDPLSLETYPSWLPTTYNLKTELPKFVCYFQNRVAEGLDNHWICKPWNLARGLDMHITNDINCIVRLPFTGPKIAQKYIEDPVLFYRPECGNVKFDVRYVVLLKNVHPLNAYVHSKFYLRFANVAFDLDDLQMYEKHFTVMNYNENSQLHHKLCEEFVAEFETQYELKWSHIERDIMGMLREVLEAAASKQPPCGIGQCPHSRALYAADIMLAWRTDSDGCRVVQPKLLEMNWTPDCQRACLYYPQFYNDVFALLFLDEVRDVFLQL